MEELSSNSEPGGSRPVGLAPASFAGRRRSIQVWREAAGLMLLFGHSSEVTGNPRGVWADWVRGDREARPGLI